MNAVGILARMRVTKAGWRPRDFWVLYEAFGFETIEAANHTKYRHPRYPRLWTTVTRSVPMSKGYAEDAVALIDELLQLEEENRGTDPNDR